MACWIRPDVESSCTRQRLFQAVRSANQRLRGWRAASRVLAWTEDAIIWRLNRHREYLDADEGAELAQLLESYWGTGGMPERVNRAMWRMAYAPRFRWADLVLSFVVSGLEALLTVEQGNFTRNFKRRATALAEELGVEGVDKAFCGACTRGAPSGSTARDCRCSPQPAPARKKLGSRPVQRERINAPNSTKSR